MNVRAHISLVILTLGCMPVGVEAASAKATQSVIRNIKNLSTIEWSIIATITGLYGWYRSRKPVRTRCTLTDLLKGENWNHIIPDFIPGHPKVSGKISIKNDEGETVDFVYKEDIDGAGPFNWIESNAKDIAKVTTAAAIVTGLLLLNKDKAKVFENIEDLFTWLVDRFSKVKPV